MKLYKITVGEPNNPPATFSAVSASDQHISSFVKDRVSKGPEGCYARVDMVENNVTLCVNKVRGVLCIDIIEDDIVDMSGYEKEANLVIMGHTNK